MSSDLPLPNRSATGMDVCAVADVVSIPYPSGNERTRVAGAAKGPSRVEIPPAGQLFCLDRSAEVTEPATGDRLGRTVERICRNPESAARTDMRKLSGGLLLDRFSDRVGQRHRVCPGRFSKPADAAVGAARDVELFQCRCDALLWPESESVGSHPGAL